MSHARTPVVVAFIVLAAVLGPSCAHEKAWVATGESLAALGETFVATGKLMDAAADAKRVAPLQYQRWSAFARYFKPTYDIACDRWLHADESAAAHAAAVLAALSAELAEWGAVATKGANNAG